MELCTLYTTKNIEDLTKDDLVNVRIVSSLVILSFSRSTGRYWRDWYPESCQKVRSKAAWGLVSAFHLCQLCSNEKEKGAISKFISLLFCIHLQGMEESIERTCTTHWKKQMATSIVRPYKHNTLLYSFSLDIWISWMPMKPNPRRAKKSNQTVPNKAK